MARVRRFIFAVGALAMLSACNRMTPEERLEKVNEALQQNDVLSAELEAKKIVEKHPDDPAALAARMRLAGIYGRDGRLDEAAAEYQAILDKLPPSSTDGIRILSYYNDLLKRQKRFPEAIALLDRYEKELTTSPEVALNLRVARADIKTAAGETTEARTLLTNLMKETTNTVAQMQFRQLYLQTFARDQDTSGAIRYLESQIAGEAPEAIRRNLVYQLAALHAQTDNYAESRRWLDEATRQADAALKDELDRNAQIQTLLDLAALYQDTGNLEGARIIMTRLYEAHRDPAFGPVIVPQLFRLLIRQGKQKEAVAFLRDAQQRYQDPQLAQEVARVEEAAKAGKLDQVDTSPLVMQFAGEPPVVPANLPSPADGGTTGSAGLAAPSGTEETTASAAQPTTSPAESTTDTVSGAETTSPAR